jgi:hypothetical protein
MITDKEFLNKTYVATIINKCMLEAIMDKQAELLAKFNMTDIEEERAKMNLLVDHKRQLFINEFAAANNIAPVDVTI